MCGSWNATRNKINAEMLATRDLVDSSYLACGLLSPGLVFLLIFSVFFLIFFPFPGLGDLLASPLCGGGTEPCHRGKVGPRRPRSRELTAGMGVPAQPAEDCATALQSCAS